MGAHNSGGHCDALRRELLRLEAEPGTQEQCREIRHELENCCPDCADTVAADELFKRMLSRSCNERAPEQLRQKVDQWFQETCYSSRTVIEQDADGTRIMHRQSRSTRYRTD